MDHIQLTKDKIDIMHIHNLINDASCGASSVFVGTTRDTFDNKKVLQLEYEAYDNMALKEMSNICKELRTRWPNLKHIAIHHRLGTVPVTEASVVIAASAPHRAAALESVTFAIDALKARVPIWKKEIYEEDPVGEWKENKECQWPQNSKSSLRAFDFTSCPIEQTTQSVPIPERLVQIKVNDSELNRRVDCFLKRKRDEINLNNIIDFKECAAGEETADVVKRYSCARTQSYLVKQKQSKGHLKVRRVNNDCGPQLRPNYSFELNKLMSSEAKCPISSTNDLVNHLRLKNIEEYMHIDPDEGDNQNLFHRIKTLENRILLLESSSPEYKPLLQCSMTERKPKIPRIKKVYLSDKLSDYIAQLKSECDI